MDEMEVYFSGEKLYGDDFLSTELDDWIKYQEEAFYDIVKDYPDFENYEYTEVNKYHGFSKIKNEKFDKVLCFGGGDAKEIIPIIDIVNEIFVIEPSKTYRSNELNGKKLNYIETESKGKINAKDNTFDLITCFGVLHHIPNVSFVLSELSRVLNVGGYLLLREPTVSMGDWRKHRKGITKNERGIPLKILNEIILKNNFKIINKNRAFTPMGRRGFFLTKRPFDNKLSVWLDHMFGCVLSFNKKYHATKWYHKLQPQSAFYVLKKMKPRETLNG